MSYQIKQAKLSAGPLSYHTAGSGKPVLYLHAAGGVSITKPLETLAQTHEVFAPVVPGFDGTPPMESLETIQNYVALVAEFAEKNIGDRFDVIGSSFGSWVALWLSVLHPAIVDHLILEVPAGFRFGGKGGLPSDPEARMKALFVHPDRVTAPAKSSEVMAGNRRTYEAISSATIPEGATVDEALSARLGEVQAVTLVLLGTEDPVVPAEAGAHLKRHIPVSQRVFVFDAAHSIEVDQPERVMRLWREFLSRGQGFVLNRSETAA